jgi:hypothetical protein
LWTGPNQRRYRCVGEQRQQYLLRGPSEISVGSGSRLTIEQSLDIASAGSGTVTIAGSGTIGGNLTVGGATATGLSGSGGPAGTTYGDWTYSGGTGSLTIDGGIVSVDGELSLLNFVQVNSAGSATFGGNLFIGSGSALEVGGTGLAAANTLTVVPAGTIAGHGLISSQRTGTINVGSSTNIPTYSLTVVDNGTIEAQDGLLKILGNVITGSTSSPGSGVGTIKIDANSALELNGTFGEGVNVDFGDNATATLILDNLEAGGYNYHYWGTLTGLVNGDQIIINNISPNGAMAVESATIGYLSGNSSQLYLQILTNVSPYSNTDGPLGPASLVQNIPINISNYNNSDYFTVATDPANANNTIITFHQGNGNPKDNPIDLAVNGQAVVQTGAGVTIGVISEGPELQAMEEIVKDIAPNATIVPLSLTNLTDQINEGAESCDIIVDDVGSPLADHGLTPGSIPFTLTQSFEPATEAIADSFYLFGLTFVTAAGNTNAFPGSILPGSHQGLPEEVTVAATNLLATPADGSLSGPYLPANTEPYSDGPGYQFSGKPNVTGPDFGPTTFIPPGLQGATQNLTLGMYGPAGEVLKGTSKNSDLCEFVRV